MVEWYRVNKSAHTYPLQAVYKFCGYSKQSYRQEGLRLSQTKTLEMEIVEKIIWYRLNHPVIGLRKLFKMIAPDIGRDKFFALARQYKLLAVIPKSAHMTTYPVRFSEIENLLAGRQFTALNHVWVTDITYFYVGDRFYYLSFMMDLYSRKIVAHRAATTLQAIHSIEVLENAIANRQITTQNNLIHHSDKGTQYFSNAYIALLEQYNIRRSAAEIVLENAHAERVKGIIKNEYLQHSRIDSFESLKSTLDKAVRLYNEERPHDKLNGLTPVEFEKRLPDIPIKDRYVLTVFTLKNVQKDPLNKCQLALFQDYNLA